MCTFCKTTGHKYSECRSRHNPHAKPGGRGRGNQRQSARPRTAAAATTSTSAAGGQPAYAASIAPITAPTEIALAANPYEAIVDSGASAIMVNRRDMLTNIRPCPQQKLVTTANGSTTPITAQGTLPGLPVESLVVKDLVTPLIGISPLDQAGGSTIIQDGHSLTFFPRQEARQLLQQQRPSLVMD
jgi:hypothetical protein